MSLLDNINQKKACQAKSLFDQVKKKRSINANKNQYKGFTFAD